MQPTSTAIAMPTSRPGVEPASAKTTQTATAATGGSHRTGTSHQSILDGYHRSCSADMDTQLSLALSARVAGHEFRHRRFAPSDLLPRTTRSAVRPAPVELWVRRRYVAGRVSCSGWCGPECSP